MIGLDALRAQRGGDARLDRLLQRRRARGEALGVRVVRRRPGGREPTRARARACSRPDPRSRSPLVGGLSVFVLLAVGMANAGEAVIGFALPTLPAIGAVEIAVGSGEPE